MKWDKFFRFGLAILFLWTSLALAAPAARAASDTTLPGSALWEPYLQQSRIDLEDAVSSPWETLKSFLPQSLGAMVQQMARDYTSVLLFLTLTAVLGLRAAVVSCSGGIWWKRHRRSVRRWRAGAAFCWAFCPSMRASSRWAAKRRQAVQPAERC